MPGEQRIIHRHDAAHMVLERDAIHEGDDGVYPDYPSCGSPAYLLDVVRDGRCTGYRGKDVDRAETEDVGDFCTAKLSLELAWVDEP